jgi:hypothetical protein
LGKKHLAVFVHYAANVVDMGVGEYHRVDVLRLDAGPFMLYC